MEYQTQRTEQLSTESRTFIMIIFFHTFIYATHVLFVRFERSPEETHYMIRMQRSPAVCTCLHIKLTPYEKYVVFIVQRTPFV